MPSITNGGVRLYYEIEGERETPPLILQTGGGGDGSMWRDGGYVSGLRDFQCILLDHRGRGRSDTPATLDGYRMERFVEDIVLLMDTLRLERAAFWGYSGGAEVGYALAATHPDRLAALITSGAIGEADRATPSEQADAEEWAHAVRAEGMEGVVRMYESEGQPMTPWFRRQMLATNPAVFADTVLAWREWHGPWSLLRQITCPTLMLVGEREDPNHDNIRAAATMAQARCVTLPGLDHITAYERSDLALAHAVPFLRGITWS